MATHKTKQLDKSQVELTITVPPAEFEPHMLKAATKISERTAIKGFRKGKAPYEVIKQEVGEMAILQEALETIVQRTFIDAVMEEKLETIGMPQINIDKVAPNNDLVYKATIALLPEVKIPDVKKLKVDQIEAKVDDKQVEETLTALRGMHAEEIVKEGKAEGTDKLVLDLTMKKEGVVVEGGESKDYQVYLSEEHYIPGFNKEVEGLKKGDEKDFTLTFPESHYQKHLAGQTIDFHVAVKEVYERRLPELNDDFAKKLGQESAESIKTLIKNNMLEEATQKATQQTEIAILDALIEKATFADLPEILIDSERQKMFHELMRDLERHGITAEQYLADIKKTEKELFDGFKEQAEKRAKAALVSRQVAKEHEIKVTDEDISNEIELIRSMYKDDAEVEESLKRPEVRDTIATTLQNRKVMVFLKETLFGKEEIKKEEKPKA